jgi:Fe/S biogenesis protein NfuA
MVSWLRGRKGSNEQASNGQPQAAPIASEPEAPLAVVNFTDAARAKVVELMEAKGYRESGALRISVKNPGFGVPDYGMSLEESGEPRSDDVVLQEQGFKILVDRASLPQVDGATVDFYDQLLQRGFKIEAPPPPPMAPPAARPELDLSNPVVATIHQVIEQHVNPSIAAHGGRATLIDVQDDVVYVELGGGCQGCAMASVTLKQGVEQLIRQAVPNIRQVVDTTDHAGGNNPYFTQAKGGAGSPFQSSKG